MYGNKAVHLNIGEKIRIEIPVRAQLGTLIQGYFKSPKTSINYGGINTTMVNGFFLEKPEVGELTPETDCVAVVYEHKQPFDNNIFFVAATGETVVISVVGVSVHDHSSIYQGGPAYGTYASEADIQQTTGDA